MSDHYATLGVEKTATKDEIKSAYRKLARQHHPDVNHHDTGAEEKFKEIGAAYEVLSDPDKKAAYDHPANTSSNPFSDFYNDFVFNRYSTTSVKQNTHVQHTIVLTMDEALNGAKRTISYNRKVYCAPCSGKGGKPEDGLTCQKCNGVGYIQEQRPGALNQVFMFSCIDCHGKGKKYTRVCAACNGFGIKHESASKEINLPKGCLFSRDSWMSGLGNHEYPESPAGHLIIDLKLGVGDKDIEVMNTGVIIHRFSLDPVRAILGEKIKVTTVDNIEIDINIPSGTESGTKIELGNYGLPISPVQRAQAYVDIQFAMPQSLSEDQKKALNAYLATR